MSNKNINGVKMKQHVSLMINSTFYDMLAEYRYFIHEIFPQLKEICLKHDIVLEYRDVAFSVPKEEVDKGIILQDLRFIDLDRTFFICFRAQKLGWKPTPEDIDGLTLDEYPELVDYIGNVSITELAIMHALKPFDKCIDGVLTKIPPVNHSLFYFRNNSYLDGLNENQKSGYVNVAPLLDKEVQDIEIAKSKDLICVVKREFDKIKEDGPRITINYYDAKWDENEKLHDVMCDYMDEYSKMSGKSLDDFVEIHEQYLEGSQRCLTDFTCNGKSLKEVMIDDILNELKLEFPENFK